MVRVKYSNSFGNYGELEDIYNIGSLAIAAKTSAQAIYEDDDGDRIVFSGQNLTYKNDMLRGGTVEKIQFIDADGHALISIAGGDFAAKPTYNAMHSDLDLRDLLIFVYADDDKFTGSNKADILYGAGGDDRVTGGKGNDWFLFGHGDGNDVILDFDANGGQGKQDLIRPFSDDYKVRASGENTVIHFGHGDSLTLMDVKKSEISADDFLLF